MVPYQPKRIKGPATKRCYVNNLSYETKWQQFKDHMKKAGTVTFVELFENPDGRSMGCGLVEYSTTEEAKKAIDTLNDSKVDGREIKVKTDEPRFYPKVPDHMGPPPHGHMGGPPGPQMGPGPMGPGMDMGPPPMGPGQQAISNVIFVSNLSYDISPKFLRDTLKASGDILKVNLEKDRDGKSKGFGTVTFAYPEMAMRCIDMFNTASIKGRRISVKLDKLTSVSIHGPPMGPGPMGPGPMGHPMGPGPGPMHGPMGHMGPPPMHGGHGPPPMHGGHGHGPPPMGHEHHHMAPPLPHHGAGGHGHPGPDRDHPGADRGYPGPDRGHPGPERGHPGADRGHPGEPYPGYGSSSGAPPPSSDQQSKLLQSIGLAAISSMLGGGSNPVLSNLMQSAGGSADPRSSSGSALENLLGRDTLEGLLKTQSVGASAGGSSSSAAAAAYQGAPPGYGAYQDSARAEHREYGSRERERESDRSRDPYSSRRDSPERYSSSSKYRQEPAKNGIFVRNIPFTLTNQQLRDYFRHAGHISDCSVMLDKEGRSRGCGTVRFESVSECERAINMFHRSLLQGREIEVKMDN